MSIWNSLFWKDVAERSLSTAAQVVLGLLTADGFNLLNLDVNAVLVTVVVAVLIVVLKSFVANTLVTSRTVSPASLVTDSRGTGGA